MKKEIPDAFESWWTLYPNKGSKKTALKAWLKLKPNLELQAVLISDTTARRRTDKWMKDDGAYVPLGATYLNNERWTDPLGEVQKRALNICSHPDEDCTWGHTYKDGMQVGKCKCGYPVNRMVEPPKGTPNA